MAQQKPDSIVRAEERVAKIRDESARIALERAEAEARQKAHRASQDAEARRIEEDDLKQASSNVNLEPATRDQLLERIRQMREEKPVEIAPVPHRTPRQQAEYEAEVAMGRAMVAKAEAEIERNREVQRKIKADEAARVGTMTPVYAPNPSQGEVFPTSGATLGKPRGG
jgi:hypothetical protein